MSKFYGFLGFGITEETTPGVWETKILEREVYGDLIRNSRRLENSGNVNDNINISNQVSIIADPYTRDNFHLIKYVKFMGTAWKVSTVDVEYPRLLLTLGGVYVEESC